MLIAYILGKKDRKDFSFVFLNLGKGKTGPQARCDLSGGPCLEGSWRLARSPRCRQGRPASVSPRGKLGDSAESEVVGRDGEECGARGRGNQGGRRETGIVASLGHFKAILKNAL